MSFLAGEGLDCNSQLMLINVVLRIFSEKTAMLTDVVVIVVVLVVVVVVVAAVIT